MTFTKKASLHSQKVKMSILLINLKKIFEKHHGNRVLARTLAPSSLTHVH